MEHPCTVTSEQSEEGILYDKSLKEIISPFMIYNIYFSKLQSLLQFRILF